MHISVGGGGQGVAVGQMSFHSAIFSKRTIGNSGNFAACSLALFDISGRQFTAPPKF